MISGCVGIGGASPGDARLWLPMVVLINGTKGSATGALLGRPHAGSRWMRRDRLLLLGAAFWWSVGPGGLARAVAVAVGGLLDRVFLPAVAEPCFVASVSLTPVLSGSA